MKIFDQMTLDARLAAIDAKIEQLTACYRYVQTVLQLQGKASVDAITQAMEEISKGNEAIQRLEDWLDDDPAEWDDE